MLCFKCPGVLLSDFFRLPFTLAVGDTKSH